MRVYTNLDEARLSAAVARLWTSYTLLSAYARKSGYSASNIPGFAECIATILETLYHEREILEPAIPSEDFADLMRACRELLPDELLAISREELYEDFKLRATIAEDIT